MELFLSLSEKLLLDFSNTDTLEECCKCLDEFINKNEKLFSFTHIPKSDHNSFTKTLFKVINHLSSNTSPECEKLQNDVVLKCLTILRILSRDKVFVDSIKSINEDLDVFANVLSYGEEQSSFNELHRIETLKCLCNWTYHNITVRKYFIEHDLTVLMLKRIENDITLNDKLFYEIRLLFLMSALENDQREHLLENGMLPILTNVLQHAVQNFDVSNINGAEHDITLHENIMGEILKALFNVTLQLSDSSSKRVTSDCSAFVAILREMLVKFHSPCFDELLTHIAHMLVNIPKDSLNELISLKRSDDEQNESDQPEVKKDMSVIDILLDALVVRMQIKNYTTMKEKTMAILTTFSYMSRINRDIRKHLRAKILPPYTPSKTRPEEFEDTRGMIVKLMTTVDVPLKNMAADVLFVLCKENTERLIRYAGYGNSAGYLASRGLMIPGMVHADGDYSDDQLTDVEDSDVDIMTGATEQPKHLDVNDMTEEEREIEAQKLMCMMDRLNELNVIKPMVVNNDGKLVEVDPQKDDDDSDDDA